MDATELYAYAKELQVSHDLLKKTADLGRLPVVNFAAGGLGKCHNVACVAMVWYRWESALVSFYEIDVMSF